MTKRQQAHIEKSRKRLRTALKKNTKLNLLAIIRSALDCPGHFYKPIIKNPPKASFKKTDPDFSYGDHPIVLCSQCVDRMRDVLCLEEGEEVPTSFDYEGWAVAK